MTPERNLMKACALQDALQSKLVADISEMLAEGHKVIMRLPIIRMAVARIGFAVQQDKDRAGEAAAVGDEQKFAM
ncbi:hypothetical protein DPMN_194465 [Dreissena polymorpha]|uniref:Uncharacterized protein n=1 Tax=Dreissena polymorpha TaxID=45954 RepID=A0A9D3XVU7_DREPO|nr:hypothetical protein DPMN_194465 [Dreissena polymorpha]